jgi:hypothetical protein
MVDIADRDWRSLRASERADVWDASDENEDGRGDTPGGVQPSAEGNPPFIPPEQRFRQALEAIVQVWEQHAPYWRDEVCDEMADIAREALRDA